MDTKGNEVGMTYSDAFAELEQIISEMESSTISIDELSVKVKRAAVLLQLCRDRLTSTEQEVNSVLKIIDKEGND